MPGNGGTPNGYQGASGNTSTGGMGAVGKSGENGATGKTGTNFVVSNPIVYGKQIPVAMVVPVVKSSTANLAANAASLVIIGTGFSASPMFDSVTFTGGVTGTITSASPTKLVVSDLSGLMAGSLSVTVTSLGIESSAPEPIATVVPLVTVVKTGLPMGASSVTISGFGFDPNGTDRVNFGGGVTGTIETVLPNEIVVDDLSGLKVGSLMASVTVDGHNSGKEVEVAKVMPAPDESHDWLDGTFSAIELV
jgi:hypothetical protein